MARLWRRTGFEEDTEDVSAEVREEVFLLKSGVALGLSPSSPAVSAALSISYLSCHGGRRGGTNSWWELPHLWV